MCTSTVAEEHVGGFQFSNRRMRRDLKREAAAATLWTNAHLSLSLNLVINYEREIIINICLPGVRPPSDRPTFKAHFLWADLD